MKTESKLNHIYGLDILKIISCIAVVGLHTFSRSGETIPQLLFMSCGFAIPIFFMVNGYLLLSRDVKPKKLLSKILHFTLLAFIWSTLLSVLYYLKDGTIFNPILDTLSVLFLQKGVMSHFWYLGGLILLYSIFIPLSLKGSSFVRKSVKLFCLISFVGAMSMDALTIIMNMFKLAGGYSIQSYIPQTFRLWTWILYFTLPIVIHDIRWVKGNGSKYLLLPAFVLKLAYDFLIGFKVLGVSLPEFYYDNIFTIFFATVLFAGVKDIEVKSERLRCIIDEVSADILGIYITHMLVKRVLLHMLKFTSVPMQILQLILTFAGALMLTSVIRRAPVLRRLV